MVKLVNVKRSVGIAALACCTVLSGTGAQAAELSNDAKASIPRDVQQVIVVDYRAMQNSSAAMNLKERVLPPELKRLETAMKSSGLKVDQDADVLAFAAFRTKDGTRIVGIAQGQFHTGTIMANFAKNKVKPEVLRGDEYLPDGRCGDERRLSEPDDDGLRR